MNIEQLLAKFYAGDSTPEEESCLKDYFLHNDRVDARWEKDRRLFRLLHEQPQAMPEEVSGRLKITLLRLRDSERVALLQPRTLWYWIGSAAAVALVCITLFFAKQPDVYPSLADTYDNPKDAALMAEKTLIFVSEKLNKGIEQTYVVGQNIEKANEVLKKTFK